MIDSDLTFEFDVNANSSSSTNQDVFQVQIRYTRRDGSKCFRVITDTISRKKFEKSQEKSQQQPEKTSEKKQGKSSSNNSNNNTSNNRDNTSNNTSVNTYDDVDVALLGLNAIRQCASIALQKNGVQTARIKLFGYYTLLHEISSNSRNSNAREEFANFMKWGQELDQHLRNNKGKKSSDEDDESAKEFFRLKMISKNELLSGNRKTEVVSRRAQCNDQLTEMYYDYKF